MEQPEAPPPQPGTPEAPPPVPEKPEVAPPAPARPEAPPPAQPIPEIEPPGPKKPEIQEPPAPAQPEIAPPGPQKPEIAPPAPEKPEIAPPGPQHPEIPPPKPEKYTPLTPTELDAVAVAPGPPPPPAESPSPFSPDKAFPSPPAASPTPPVTPRKRRWLRVAAVAAGLLVAAAVAVVLLAPGYVRGRILDEARDRGIVLAFGDLELGLTRLRLHDVKVSLAGVPDFEASAAWVDVEVEGSQPKSISAAGLSISMTGTEVITALGKWKSAHPAALAAPVSGVAGHVEWHPVAGATSALVADEARMAITADTGSIDAASASFGGRGAGPMKIAWTAPADGFVVEIHPGAKPLSAVHAEVRSAKDGTRIKLTLDRTPLGPLQEALGIPKGSEGLQADGEVEMPLPSLAKPAPVDGTLRLAVKGFVPPHPKELDGILFGDTTTVRARFQLAADLGGAKLSQVTAEAGALSLTGSGDVARDGLDAKVSLKLKGTIPCTALAKSAAVAKLGREWGGLAGGLAAGALQGSVAVSITIDARASDVKSAKIGQSAHIGCKVSLPGLPTIVIR
jgi:hypothetical protein